MIFRTAIQKSSIFIYKIHSKKSSFSARFNLAFYSLEHVTARAILYIYFVLSSFSNFAIVESRLKQPLKQSTRKQTFKRYYLSYFKRF